MNSTKQGQGQVTGRREAGIDGKAVLESYGPDQFIHLIPSIDFEAQRKFRAGTQADQVIDYFAKHFHSPGGKP